MNKILSNKKTIAIFVLPTLLIYLFVAIVPLFITSYYSFFDYKGLAGLNPTEDFIGLANYVRMFTNDPAFFLSMKNTLILIVGSLFIQLPFAFLLANTLAKGVFGEKAFRTIYFIPVVISATVIGKLFFFIFSSNYGMLNSVVRILAEGIVNLLGESSGIGMWIMKNDLLKFNFNWMTNEKTAFYTIAIAAIWQYIGYHMLIMYAGIKSISTDYYEAAMIDGATGAKATWHITIPLISPVIKTCVILATVGSVQTYDIVVSMAGSYGISGTQVPAVLLWRSLFREHDFGYGSAQAFLLVVICLSLSYAITKLFKRAEDNASL